MTEAMAEAITMTQKDQLHRRGLWGSGCFGGESGGRHDKRDRVEGLSEQGHYLAQPRRGGGRGF